ncbi:MAG: DUF488 domain-containing protein [Vulcanimicrobiaceae bacterium]
MTLMIQLKRAYDKPVRDDGFRILVDRLWPRGVRKEDLRLDTWAKALAPSTTLRQWFAHDPARWTEFCKRYRAELASANASETIEELLKLARSAKTITLVYAAKDTEHNEAIVLRELFTRIAEHLHGDP